MFPKLPFRNPRDEGEDSDDKQTNASNTSRRHLYPLVEPRPFDVLLGRGKSNLTHPGNQRFQVLVEMNHESYFAASSRQEKVHITQQVVVAIREGGGWFLRYDEAQTGWVQISEQAARKKVAQAIQYRRRRVAEQDSVAPSDPQLPRESPWSTTNAKDTGRLSGLSFFGGESGRFNISEENSKSLFSTDPEFATTLAFQQQQLANQQVPNLDLALPPREEKQEENQGPATDEDDSKQPAVELDHIDDQQRRRQASSLDEEHLLSDDEILSALGFSVKQPDTDSHIGFKRKDPPR